MSNVPNKREQNQTCLDSAEREGLRPKGNVPNLRFPEFQGEWKEHKLEDITAEIGDGIHATPIYDDNGTFYFVNGNNISEYGIIITATTQKVTEEEALRNNASALNSYSILLSINGTVGNVALYKNESIMLGKSACYINVSSNINRNYIFYYLMMPKCQFYFTSELTGTTIKNLSLKSVRKTKVLLPNANEQSKIARLFDAINERIATQNKIIDKLQSLIKGLRVSLMQIENGNIVHLDEIAQIYQPQTISSTELTEDGFLVYGANGIIGKYKQYNHKTEQICITCRGNTCGMVNYTKPMSWITGNAMVINTDEHQNKVCKRYLYHYLSAYNFNSIISGSGQPQIVRTPLEQLKVPLPTFLEQKQKATFLDKIQGKIEISNKTLNLYLQQKQYLLRQMFI